MASDGSDSALAASVRLLLRYGLVFIRLYLGGWMLLNGLNHFLPIFPQPMGGAKSSELMVTLIDTHLFDLVKGAEILVGVLMLLDLFVPVALVMGMPISVIVWFNQAFLGRGPFQFHMSTGCLVYNIILLIAYLPCFLPMMRMRTDMGTLSDLWRLGVIFARPNPAGEPPEARRRGLTVLAGLAITAVLFWQLHPWTPQPAGAGQTPAAIVTEYMNLAYGEGRRADADRMYVSPGAIKQGLAQALPRNGQPLAHTVLDVIAQGPDVAVRQQIGGGAPDEVVDIYRVEKNYITSHVRVTGAAKPG